MGPALKSKGCSWAIHPVSRGRSDEKRRGATYRYPAPGPPQSHFTEPPVAKSTSQAATSTGTVPADW